ncbi:MAG: hypothetical protein ACYCSF_13310 [Acidimicrobiales bacterium]
MKERVVLDQRSERQWLELAAEALGFVSSKVPTAVQPKGASDDRTSDDD